MGRSQPRSRRLAAPLLFGDLFGHPYSALGVFDLLRFQPLASSYFLGGVFGFYDFRVAFDKHAFLRAGGIFGNGLNVFFGQSFSFSIFDRRKKIGRSRDFGGALACALSVRFRFGNLHQAAGLAGRRFGNHLGSVLASG